MQNESSVVDFIVSRHSEKIRQLANEALTDIDTRYLSMPAGRAYGEVLDAAMRKMSNDDRIKLSSDLAVSDKKSPLEF